MVNICLEGMEFLVRQRQEKRKCKTVHSRRPDPISCVQCSCSSRFACFSCEYLKCTCSAGNWQRQPMVVNSSSARSLITLEMNVKVPFCTHITYKWSGMRSEMYRMPLNIDKATMKIERQHTHTYYERSRKKGKRMYIYILFWSTLLKALLF